MLGYFDPCKDLLNVNKELGTKLMLAFVSAVPGTTLRAGSGFRKPEHCSQS